ncbi:WD40 repeat domain-containing protein [Geodermatophilus sp. YIM 151500]|uniref:WD40 repeat domain-containing protein n=1 Tax=Geodermatophilus sp. YIM 151500 TaxID=2984531 RepID=UPI0021E3D264|nr:WD40 repeat domain-containing protein [Geodermatophilus sp. YIM 151500]MCV2489975.1 WD40 repeat domain-containing protein [Geodermatophilus sp. YIM 151500]
MSMVSLGVGAHPHLRPGIHLRWFVDPDLGFPPLGFDVFRRSAWTGDPRSLNFADASEGQLSHTFSRGPTTWSTAPGQSPSEIFTETTGQGSVRLLRPSRTSSITCRFDPSERPVHRIEVEVVHAAPGALVKLPVTFAVWGIAGDARVAMGAVTLTQQNARTPVTVTVTGDALEGFQIEGRRSISNYYGILKVRWSPVADGAVTGWGTALNTRRIGFPVTVPGYLVTHKRGPDQGSGAQDWLEAADRLSPTGAAADVPAVLAQRFGPPAFAGTRQVLTEALARRRLTKVGSGTQEPNITLDAVRLVLLGALDPDFARLAGLGLVDGSAVPGQRYDYRVVGYWPGQLRPQLVCIDVPNGGGHIPAGGTVTLPGGGGGTTVVTAGTVLEPPGYLSTLGVSGVTGAGWKPDGRQVLTRTSDGRALIFDSVEGVQVMELPHGAMVRGAAWSPADPQIVTWGDDQVARTWDADTAARRQALKHPQPILGTVWRPDGRQIATWAEDGYVRVWAVDGNGDPLVLWPVPGCLGVAWAPDGRQLLTWAEDGCVQVWAAADATAVSARLHPSRPLGAAWSPDGRWVLSWAGDGDAWIWAADGTGDPRVLRHPSGRVGAAWGPREHLVLTWGTHGPLRLWDVDSGRQVRIFPHDGGVAGAVWSPDGSRVLSWGPDGVALVWEVEGDASPRVIPDTDPVVGAVWSSGARQVVTWSAGGTATAWTVSARVRSLNVTLPTASDRVRFTGRSAGPDPLLIRAFSGSQLVRTQSVAPGAVATVTVEAPGTTSATVTGVQLTVTEICFLQLVRDQDRQEAWICFGATPGPIPVLTPPTELTATAIPGFAREGAAEQMVGLVIEPHSSARPATELLPRARSVHDPISYEVRRRADGAQPLADPAAGLWLDLITDPATGEPRWADLASEPLVGQVRPVLRSTFRPALHTSPQGWPAAAQDLLDGRLDLSVRHYSYRIRGRDLFGRVSDWSEPVTVDAADRVPPPAPGALTARWVDRIDPWLELGDLAELDVAGVDRAVVVRWSWPLPRREQAPDTHGFRVYWHGRPFSTLLTTITVDPQPAPTTYTVSVPLGLGIAPPTDAFRGDWLRQGDRQYSIRGSSAADPTTLTLDATGVPAPVRGPCAVSLRSPDPQHLDLLGNPLRPDPARAAVWEHRVRQGPLTTVESAILQRTHGVAVSCQQVQADTPRPGMATVILSPGWHWSGALPEPAELVTGTADPWTIVGWALGRRASLLLDTAKRQAPMPGPALVRTADVQTVTLDASLPTAAPFSVLGGTVRADGLTRDVLAHASSPLRLVLAQGTGAGRLVWFPDHQVVLADVTLPVSDAAPQATGMVGVSAVDGRPWTADTRARPSEPGGPGNEGPVASVAVRRDHLAVPTTITAPAGATGPGELWAPVPDEFSGASRFPLRWQAAGATRFQIEHATLDAVLDADVADRTARRGAYVGLPVLDPTGLAQWRAAQAALGAADLQKLATAQSAVFLPLGGPVAATDPLVADPQPGWLRWPAPLDGSASGRHFLRVRVLDAAGNVGPPGPATLPIVVPDARRPPTPQLRRVVDADRAVWLQWDGTPGLIGYRIMRAELPAGAQPDVRDMTLVATLTETGCPEPLPVTGGAVRLPGEPPHSIVAVYRAEEYDLALGPEAQTEGCVPGPPVLSGTRVTGLGALPDGALVFVVGRESSEAPPRLLTGGAGHAWRDATVAADRRYQYRVLAVRTATVGPGVATEIRSLPSDVEEGAPFDTSPPVPPPGAAVWDAAAAAVRLTWPTAGLVAGLELLPQRMDAAIEEWVGVAGWTNGATGSVNDRGVQSGHSYLYRLRVRVGNRTSEAEPMLGPVTIP